MEVSPADKIPAPKRETIEGDAETVRKYGCHQNPNYRYGKGGALIDDCYAVGAAVGGLARALGGAGRAAAAGSKAGAAGNKAAQIGQIGQKVSDVITPKNVAATQIQ